MRDGFDISKASRNTTQYTSIHPSSPGTYRMRLGITIGVLLGATSSCWVASFTPSSVVAPSPRGITPECRKVPGSCMRRPLSAAPRDLPEALPPRDESFTPIATLRELLAAPESPVGSQRYDGIGQLTGGIWRTKVIGIIASTVRWSLLTVYVRNLGYYTQTGCAVLC